jgi:hypothetical protein
MVSLIRGKFIIFHRLFNISLNSDPFLQAMPVIVLSETVSLVRCKFIIFDRLFSRPL